jgi:hypothetical protein
MVMFCIEKIIVTGTEIHVANIRTKYQYSLLHVASPKSLDIRMCNARESIPPLAIETNNAS